MVSVKLIYKDASGTAQSEQVDVFDADIKFMEYVMGELGASNEKDLKEVKRQISENVMDLTLLFKFHDQDHQNILNISLINLHTELFSILVDHCYDKDLINTKIKCGDKYISMLDFLIEKGYNSLIPTLMRKGAYFHSQCDMTALQYARLVGNEEAVFLIAKTKIELGDEGFEVMKGFTDLHIHCFYNIYTFTVESLSSGTATTQTEQMVEENHSIESASKQTPLMVAASRWNYDTMTYLIEHYPVVFDDASVEYENKVYRACFDTDHIGEQKDFEKCVRYLYKRMAEVSYNGLLHLIIEHYPYLLRYIDVEDNWIMLFKDVIIGTLDTCKAKDQNGDTVFHVAAKYGRSNFLRWLIDDIPYSTEDVNQEGNTALHIIFEQEDPIQQIEGDTINRLIARSDYMTMFTVYNKDQKSVFDLMVKKNSEHIKKIHYIPSKDLVNSYEKSREISATMIRYQSNFMRISDPRSDPLFSFCGFDFEGSLD